MCLLNGRLLDRKEAKTLSPIETKSHADLNMWGSMAFFDTSGEEEFVYGFIHHCFF